MINNSLQKLLEEIGQYQAQYKTIAIADKPVGCDLPPFTAGSITLSPLPPLDLEKDCNYNYVQTPLYIDPFIPPDPCPTGLLFTTKSVNILPAQGFPPSSVVPIGLSKNEDNPCGYDLDIPGDIVIPCHPNGPVIEGTATITITNQGTGETTLAELSIIKDPDSACHWVLGGGGDIVIPEVPCPDGIVFNTGLLELRSTCSTVPKDTKRVTITKRDGLDCLYDINFPPITIPCYPDGPSVQGTTNLRIKDRGVLKSTQVIGFIPPLNPPDASCCDFNFGGDIDIEIPCQNGITFLQGGFTINSTGPSVEPPTSQSFTIIKSEDDLCDYTIDFPDLDIPCYPNGPSVGGSISVTVGDGVSSPAPQTISIVTDPDATCQFLLDGDINIPIGDQFIRCDTFGFTGGIRVKLAANKPFLSSVLNSVELKENDSDCGAELTGDLNLNLPGFVTECTTMQFGGGIQVKLNGQTSPNVINTVTLTANPNGCGSVLNGVLDLPIPDITIPCLDGFNFGGSIQVYQGTTPITGSNNTITLIPAQGGCGASIGGVLRLTQTGGGGVGYSKYLRGAGYGENTLTSVIQPEGGRCLYINPATIEAGDAGPLDFRGKSLWECLGCEEGKHYHPFKLIKAKPSDNQTTADNYVKVVPNSLFFREKSASARYDINGLDVPFILGPSEIVYLEVTYQAPNDRLVFIDASIGKASSVQGWDATIGEIPSVYLEGEEYKHVKPLDAGTIKTGVLTLVSRHVGKNADEITATATSISDWLDQLALQNRPQAPRAYKAYILLASTSAAITTVEDEDTDEETTVYGDSSYDLWLSSDESTRFGLTQYLKTHVQEVGSLVSGVPTLLLQPYGSNPKEKPINDVEISVHPDSGEVTITVKETPTAPDGLNAAPAAIGIRHKMTHVYYTVDGAYPAIDTFKETSSNLYNPADKPVIQNTGTFYVQALATYPGYKSARTFKKVVRT